MQTTLKKVIEFNNNALQYLKDHEDERSTFIYALDKVQKKNADLIKDEFTKNLIEFTKKQQELIEDRKIDLCEKDKDGLIKEEGDKFSFSAENRKKLRKEITDSNERVEAKNIDLQSKEITAFTYMANPNYIPKLNLGYISAFNGFVIPKMSEEEEEAFYLGTEKPTPTN